MAEFFEAVFEARLQPVYFAYQGAMDMSKYYGVDHRLMVAETRGDVTVWINRLKDMREVGGILVSRFLNEKGFREKIGAAWEEKKGRLDIIYAEIRRANLRSMADEGILSLYRRFCSVYLDFWSVGKCVHPMHFGLDERFNRQLRTLLANAGRRGECAHFAVVFSNPTKQSFIGEEEEGFRKILSFARRNGEGSRKVAGLLKIHAAKYFWIRNTYARTHILSALGFRKELDAAKRDGLPPKKKTAVAIKKEKENAFAELRAPEAFRRLVELMDYMASFQDERKKYTLIADHWLDAMLSEIGRRKGYSLVELKAALPAEIIALLDGKELDRKELKKRSKYHVAVFEVGSVKVFTGNEAKKELKKIGFFRKHEGADQIYGTCASTGTAIGPVRVVFKTEDLAKLKEGDVLVTSMTRPELVPGMKKASAIVTDEGGLTCHAAILSREMGKPCVVGCINATKLLKDGEIVEVRASHGVVRKVK